MNKKNIYDEDISKEEYDRFIEEKAKEMKKQTEVIRKNMESQKSMFAPPENGSIIYSRENVLKLMYFANDDFYHENQEFEIERLVNSIEENGLINPILVGLFQVTREEEYAIWSQGEGNLYMVIDGRKRLLAYKKLYEITHDEKYLKVPHRVYRDITMEEANRLREQSNATY